VEKQRFSPESPSLRNRILPVIPAKAGIQFVDSAILKVRRVDSRSRRNDWGLGRPPLVNETTTLPRHLFRWARNRYNARSVSIAEDPCR
jgi:hypothetical protein